MVFWSFLAGLITFYCSIGPETLLPNIFFSIRPKNNVSHTCHDQLRGRCDLDCSSITDS